MDKIRKLGAWLWLYKERLLLLIVVCVLCWRVYIAINPPPAPPAPPVTPPVSLNAAGANELPPEPGLAPKTLIPMDRKELARRNPFWYYAEEGSADTDGDAPPEVDLELRGIQTMPDGAQRARLKMGSRTRYYAEGDDIGGQYTLVSIDAENETVTVRAEGSRTPIVLREE